MFLLFILIIGVAVIESSILYIPTQFSSLSLAIQNVQEGDTILFSNGVFSGEENCGQALLVSNVTISGSGVYSTFLNCNSSETIPVQIYATSSILKDLSITNIGLNTSGAGLIFTTDSQFSLIRCRLLNGLVQDPPSLYSWRAGSGGALAIASSESPVQISIVEVQFLNNRISCSIDACLGGAVIITISNGVTDGTNGYINIVNSTFDSNQNIALDQANAIEGGAVSITNEGSAALSIKIENTHFINNYMGNMEGTAYGAVATGGAVSVMNIDFSVDPPTVYSTDFNLSVSNSTFLKNSVVTYACNSLQSTANGAGLAPFGVNFLNIFDSGFEDNYVDCKANITSSGGGVAEGAALFLEGLYKGNPDSLQPVANIIRCQFINNTAICSGPGCLSLGGGIAIAVAKEITLNDVTATSNQVFCEGLGCGSQGGFLQLQNGPTSTVGEVTNMMFQSMNVNATENIAKSFPPKGYSSICDFDVAACDSPSYGGAVAILSWNERLSSLLSNWTFARNSASCGYKGCLVWGAHIGSAATTVTGGTAASVSIVTNSSEFYCGNVTCFGSDCISLQQIWSTDYYSIETSGEVFVGGAGCEFIGNLPPRGSSVTVSPTCNIQNSGNYEICSDASTYSTDDGNDDDTQTSTDSNSSSSSSSSQLRDDAIIGISIGCIAFVVFAGYLLPTYFCYRKRTKNDEIGIRLTDSSRV